MKKILLALLSSFALFTFTLSFAGQSTQMPSTPYHGHFEPISSATAQRAKSMTGMGPAVNIVVINYTGSYVDVNYPGRTDRLPPQTADRITNDTWGYTPIILADSFNRQIFFPIPGQSNLIPPMAIISIYASGGTYTTNVFNG